MLWKAFNDLDKNTWPDCYDEKLLIFDGQIAIGHLTMPYSQFNNYKVEWCIQGEDELIIDIDKVTYWSNLPEMP